MQNLIKHPLRPYIVPLKLVGHLFRCHARKYGISKAIPSNVKFDNELNRLCFSTLCWKYSRRHKELNGLRSLFLKHDIRRFSTNSSRRKNSNKSADNSNKKPIPPQPPMVHFSIFLLGFLIFGQLIFFMLSSMDPRGQWNEFVREFLLKGQVREIIIYSYGADAILKPDASYRGKPTSPIVKLDSGVKNIEDKVREIEKNIGIRAEDGLRIRYADTQLSIPTLCLIALAGFYLLRNAKFKMSVKWSDTMGKLGNIRNANFTLVEPQSGKGVRFNDVAGLKEAKQEVMEFVDYLKNPERYEKLGAKIPKGVLMLGPPGCGKTLLAKAVATESNVPFLSMNGTEFIELIGGVGASRVRSLFAEARKRAPSIIYIDEIDTIGKKRRETLVGNNEFERTLNQLLVEMDGMTSTSDIMVLASTNRAEVLDKALLRPGRFDRHILIDFPTLPERSQIFHCHLKPLVLEGDALGYSKSLAYVTPGFSGADIANVCNESALRAASLGKSRIEYEDLLYAVDKMIGGTMKKSNTITPSEKEVVVYHEAGHTLSAWLLEHISPLMTVSVIQRMKLRTGFMTYVDTQTKLRSSEHLFQQMCVLLAGRVAESIMFNKISTRAEDDLKEVTELAYRQVQQFGMSPKLGLISFSTEYTTTQTKKPYSKKLAKLMDLEARRIITEAHEATTKLLLDNKDKLIILAKELLKRETLKYPDIEKLIGPPAWKKKGHEMPL